jgi:periplasmic divalent cation tolerance protein
VDNLLDADSVHVVYITIPRDLAEDMAQKLVEKRLAACVSISPNIESFFWWNGKVKREKEARLRCKTVEKKFHALMEFVHAHHPYEVPEIISFPIANGHPDYIAWVHNETEGKIKI